MCTAAQHARKCLNWTLHYPFGALCETLEFLLKKSLCIKLFEGYLPHFTEIYNYHVVPQKKIYIKKKLLNEPQ